MKNLEMFDYEVMENVHSFDQVESVIDKVSQTLGSRKSNSGNALPENQSSKI